MLLWPEQLVVQKQQMEFQCSEFINCYCESIGLMFINVKEMRTEYGDSSGALVGK